MASQKVLSEMNEQIKHELYSAYLYLSMAAYMETQDLPGFAHWMESQAKEEFEHAMKFYEYVHDQGGRVVLQALDQPPSEFESVKAVMDETLKHEQFVTSLIHKLYETSLKENDYASQIMLNWFVSEQVEEEKTVSDILSVLERIGESGNGLIMLDRQMGAR
ncbi:MAG: ferritin [Anaerolineaceae bacterium]|nr:ferritin [Anaerolineaceae bacterium]